jgi:hypothetical protein
MALANVINWVKRGGYSPNYWLVVNPSRWQDALLTPATRSLALNPLNYPTAGIAHKDCFQRQFDGGWGLTYHDLHLIGGLPANHNGECFGACWNLLTGLNAFRPSLKNTYSAYQGINHCDVLDRLTSGLLNNFDFFSAPTLVLELTNHDWLSHRLTKVISESEYTKLSKNSLHTYISSQGLFVNLHKAPKLEVIR